MSDDNATPVPVPSPSLQFSIPKSIKVLPWNVPKDTAVPPGFVEVFVGESKDKTMSFIVRPNHKCNDCYGRGMVRQFDAEKKPEERGYITCDCVISRMNKTLETLRHPPGAGTARR